jgi:hypothetical protein
MELHRLTFLHDIADRNGACGTVGTQQVPNKKIAALEPTPMFIDHNTKMERPMSATSVFLRQRFKDSLQPL